MAKKYRFTYVSPRSAIGRKHVNALLQDLQRRFEQEDDNVALLLAADVIIRSFAPPWVIGPFTERLENWRRSAPGSESLDKTFKVECEKEHAEDRFKREE
jgi:hypothetical protein